MSELTQFEVKSVLNALNNMFRKEDNFSICTVDTCMKVTGAQREKSYEVLRLYHCRKWSEMDAETRANIFKMTVDLVLSTDGFPEIVLASERKIHIEVEQKPSIAKRIMEFF